MNLAESYDDIRGKVAPPSKSIELDWESRVASDMKMSLLSAFDGWTLLRFEDIPQWTVDHSPAVNQDTEDRDAKITTYIYRVADEGLISQDTADIALRMIRSCRPRGPFAVVGVSGTGELTITWSTHNAHLTVDILPDGRIEVFQENDSDGTLRDFASRSIEAALLQLETGLSQF